MKVHLIRRGTIESYADHHSSGKSSFRDWLSKIKFADWQTPEDIQSTFNSADLLGKGSYRVVFDIAGNNYRMICVDVF